MKPSVDRRFYSNPDAPMDEMVGSGATTVPEAAERRIPRRLVLRLPDGREVSLMRNLTIGQSSRNDVVLRDERVSRRHCVVEVGRGCIRVRDLNSTNGTSVNGLRVSSADLTAGGIITVGRTQLRVVLADDHTPALVGDSEAMKRLRGLVARALHDQSGRRGAFIALNCGSIPRDLVESELFGHERGAFTGANAARKGMFQEADGGTLFLDEVGELSAAIQVKLLRVLQERVFCRVGSTVPRRVDVRFVAATHRELEADVRTGRFREDLFYRLAVIRIKIPPLRERPEDVEPLARALLTRTAGALGRRDPGIADDALAALRGWRWPGNVRELGNELERALVLRAPGATGPISADEVSASLDDTPREPAAATGTTLASKVDALERAEIESALRRARGVKARAAQALGLSRPTLDKKMSDLDIDLWRKQK